MSETPPRLIGTEAADFFVRLRDPDDRTRSAAEFSEWLTRSPAHVQAFLSLVMAWSAIEVPAHGTMSSEALIAAARAEPLSGKVTPLGTAPVSTAPVPAPVLAPVLRRTGPVRLAWAAAAMIVLAVTAWVGRDYFSGEQVYRNGGTEVRRVTLSDGSVVALNANSEVRVLWSPVERRLELRRGRARFQVAKDSARPFLVDTALGRVRAVGTVFDVDVQQQQTRVTVIEGVVSVQSGDMVNRTAGEEAGSVQLAAGDHATISSEEGGRGGAPTIMAWTAQRVVFRGAALGIVVDEFNRYRPRPVIIDDSGLATLIISGVFDPRNPDSLLTYLQLYENVQVENAPDGSVLLSRRANSTSPLQAPREGRN